MELADAAWRKISLRLRSVQHPSSVSALRADPPSPTGEKESAPPSPIKNRRQLASDAGHFRFWDRRT
ncbi:hypothetical protein C9427_26300 [Mesorhizobium helmanticense]|uniref:Uncharacterized protein n=1 Tax=Mesorhizobium helmanticense TaxID=1776423 RepID=A0A2T4IPU1_9HYPH|nr:hypothetical protein C9427_26300 [Mesorhizobium helmanticense]